MIATVRHDALLPRELAEKVRRPVIVRVTEFDEESTGKFGDEMSAAHETGQDIIPVLIDSYGGDPYALIGMIAILDAARLPVVTVVEGKAMSCGAMLFALGADRYMAPTATLMFHDISQMTFDDKKTAEVRADADEMERMQDMLFVRMAEHIGKPKTYFSTLLDENKHADVYMTAQHARRQNIATHIVVPSFETTIAVTHRFSVDGSRKTAVSSYRKTTKPIHNAARAKKVRSK